MGVVENVGFHEFPTQGVYVGEHVIVCFRYDSANTLPGVVVRDDDQEPWVTIIKLDDGRHILATECMWQPADP